MLAPLRWSRAGPKLSTFYFFSLKLQSFEPTAAKCRELRQIARTSENQL